MIGGRDVFERIVFSYDPMGRLVFRDGVGSEHVDVTPVRGFPISDPDYGVSICDADGHELLWIERLSDLPVAARETLAADLAQREFMPVVQRIVRISANSEPCEWEVETDRGRTRFVLKIDEDVRRLDDRRAMVTDSNGVSYLIPDLAALDAISRRYLERYL
ncbi:MAG: DUF1854 domain-containing protein [Pirellulales bacterium]